MTMRAMATVMRKTTADREIHTVLSSQEKLHSISTLAFKAGFESKIGLVDGENRVGGLN